MVNAIFPKKRGAGRRKQGASNRDAEQNFSREPFTAEVVDMASDGRGVIHHPEGRTCFVSGVWLGEKGTFRLTDIKGRTGSAEVVELTQVAPQKVTAPCVYHGHSAKHCGGCAWQSIEYSAQLQAKQTRVEKALANLCKPDAIAPILGAEQTEGYRNRAQFKTDGSKLGYVAPSSNNIVDVETYAIERACQFITHKLPDFGQDKTIAIIDIGSVITSITVLHNLSTIYTREEVFGGKQLTEAIQRRYGLTYEEAGLAKKQGALADDYVPEVLDPFREALIPLIRRSLQFFFSASNYNEVDHIVLAGGGAFIPGLTDLVTERLGTSCTIADPFIDMTISNRVNRASLAADAPALMVCCGLALRSFYT